MRKRGGKGARLGAESGEMRASGLNQMPLIIGCKKKLRGACADNNKLCVRYLAMSMPGPSPRGPKSCACSCSTLSIVGNRDFVI